MEPALTTRTSTERDSRDRRRATGARRLLASLELPGRRADLSARQPAPAGAAPAGAREAALARPLGDDARLELPLHPPRPRDPQARPRRDLRLRARSRRPGRRRPGV